VEALQTLSKTEYRIIIVTNQSGIGRGLYAEKDLKKLHQWLLRTLTKKVCELTIFYTALTVRKKNARAGNRQ